MDVNNLKELKEKNKHALIDDIDFFRAKNKAKRDRWVVCQFLTILGISFKENELEVPNTDPPDIVYKEAQFEIKEIMDQARKRHTEYKDELLRLDSIKDPSEIFRLYTPKGLTPQNIVDITLSELKKYEHKYDSTVKNGLDLLFYFNLIHCHLIQKGEYTIPVGIANYCWRSVSVVGSNFSCVLYACDSAPHFIKSFLGKFVYR